jgi:MraZ protein
MWGSVEEKGKFVAELLGQHRYQLDAKGRIALPSRFREPFADGAYLTLGQDGCLYVFGREEFQRQSEEVRGLRPMARQSGRGYARMFFGNADRVELDGQGRVTIPQRLRSQIGLEREAVVVGVYDHLEIWSGASWDTYERDQMGAYSSGVLEPEDR